MKQIKMLKTTIEVFYVLLYFVLIIGGIVAGDFMGNGRMASLIEAPAMMMDNFNTRVTILIVLSVLVAIPFFYGISNLMKSMSFLENGQFFSNEVTSRFEKTGKLFIVSGLCGIILKLLTPLLLQSQIWVGVDLHILFLLFVIIIGLFFRFLAQIFQKARLLQEENNLTI